MPLPMGWDWLYIYYPATRAMLVGQSPYAIAGIPFANAPWTLFPLIPLALLPVEQGRLLLILVSVIAFALVARRFGATPITAAAFILSPLVMRCLYYGQIDWLPLLGAIMPPWLGLFFVATKPQVCGLIAVYWLVEAWRAKTIVRTFAPITLVTLFSFAVFGLWPLKMSEFFIASFMWPWSIILSAALLVMAIRQRDGVLAIVASPFASPYARVHSFVGVLLPFLRCNQWGVIMITIALWVIEVSK